MKRLSAYWMLSFGSLMLGFILLSAPASAQITSTFDTDDEGWTAIDHDSGPIPTYVSENGNPGGFIQVEDGVGGTATYFVAPAKFPGNRSAYYGGTLQFDLQVDRTPNSSTAGVRLTGGGLVLVKLLPQLPVVAPAWSSYTLALDESEQWRLTSATGSIATAEDLQIVLASLTALQINGEYSTAAGDGGGLDNVVMTPADPADLHIFTAVSPNEDGLNDYWLIDNINTRPDTQENTVSIFNRWGDRVWEGVNYNNTDVVFTGLDETGKKLLPGVYYYVIAFTSGRQSEAGFISIRH